MLYESDINKAQQYAAQQLEINMPRGSCSVDKAPDSQWIYLRGFETRKAQIFFYYISILCTTFELKEKCFVFVFKKNHSFF